MRTFAFIVAALIFAMTILSWCASYARPHGLGVHGFRRYAIVAGNGFLQFQYSTKSDIISEGWNAWSVVEVGFQSREEPLRFVNERRLPGLSFSHGRLFQQAELLMGGEAPEPSTGRVTPFGERTVAYAVPHWLVALVLAIPVAWLFNAWRRRVRAERMASGQCVACGYDLRATPDRCPECGQVPQLPSIVAGGT